MHPETTGQHRVEQRFVTNEERRVRDLFLPFRKVSGRLPTTLLTGVSYEWCHASSYCDCSGAGCQSSLDLIGVHDCSYALLLQQGCTQGEMNI